MSCGSSIARCFLIVFNIVFFVLGAVCLGVGIWVLVDKPSLLTLTAMVDQLDNTNAVGLLEGAAIGVLIGGSIVFVIGFFGFCGALKQNKCCLYLYAIFVGLILASEIAGGVVGFIYKDKVESELQKFLQDTIDQKYDGSFDYTSRAITTSEVYSLAWEFVHWSFECCGINDYRDFATAANWNRTAVVSSITLNLTAPFTCCKTTSSSLPTSTDSYVNVTACVLNINQTTYSNAWNGCYAAAKDKILEYSTVVIGIGIGIALVEVLGIISACCLIKAINKEDDKGKK